MSIALILIVGAAMTHSSLNAGTSKANSGELQDPTVAKVYTDDLLEKPFSKVIGNDYCEWRCESSDQCGVYTASSGQIYILAEIRIKNDGYSQISTSPESWKLIADNVSYTHNIATRVNQFGVPSEVGHGVQTTVEIIYLVQGEPKNARLKYIG